MVVQAFALFAKFSTLQSIPHVQNHLLIHQTFRTRTTLPAAMSVETIDKCLRKLKIGKASRPDGLNAEHLLNAHPALLIHLIILEFKGIAFVPSDFCVRSLSLS